MHHHICSWALLHVQLLEVPVFPNGQAEACLGVNLQAQQSSLHAEALPHIRIVCSCRPDNSACSDTRSSCKWHQKHVYTVLPGCRLSQKAWPNRSMPWHQLTAPYRPSSPAWRRNDWACHLTVAAMMRVRVCNQTCFCAQLQAIREDMAKQKHAWASARRTLQAQQSSLQDECNDLACQLAERETKLRSQEERIAQLKKMLEDANLAVAASRRNSEVTFMHWAPCPLITVLLSAKLHLITKCRLAQVGGTHLCSVYACQCCVL